MRKVLEFKECSTCAAKTGSPHLCPSCLNNREAISELYIRAGEDEEEDKLSPVIHFVGEICAIVLISCVVVIAVTGTVALVGLMFP